MIAKLCYITFFMFVMLFVSTATKIALMARAQCTLLATVASKKNIVHGSDFTLLSICSSICI